MLDIDFIRKNPHVVQKAADDKQKKGIDVQALLKVDEERRSLQQQFDGLKAQQNTVSKAIQTADSSNKASAIEEAKAIKEQVKNAEELLKQKQEEFKILMYQLPNIPSVDTPIGKDDSENVVIDTWGEKPQFDFEPKNHWEIAEAFDMLDTKRSAKVSGSRFCYLKNELALMQRALVFWAFTEVSKKGYAMAIPPFMTRKEAIIGTGFFDKNENYCVNPGDDDLYLIGTSEVPMTSYFADEILNEKDLPHKFVAHSPCFRKEAGSYGKDMQGLIRLHQFEKVEMVIFCKPEDSTKMHEEIRSIEEELLQKLGLHYQVLNICTGDLGGSATKKYDLEAWLPGQQKYREMTSTSICTDYQTRRLNIRIRKEDGSIGYAHTLNGTAVSSRPLAAILETYQQKDGSVVVPEVLRPYMGMDVIVR